MSGSFDARRAVVAASVLALPALSLIASIVGAACSATDPFVAFASPDGSTLEAMTSDAAWGATECAGCVRDRCRADRDRCRSEPTCARHLDCVEACPSSEGAEPAAACVASCPPPSGSAAERAASDLERCRTEGAGVECRSCPARSRGRTSPLLNQSCENPTWDAGPDATAVQESCTRCVGERCCESRDRCRADPTCFELRDCFVTCADDACIDACFAKYDTSVASFDEFVTCSSIACAERCGVVPVPCEACINAGCADERIECAASRDCSLLFRCVGRCKDADCGDECNAKYPGGTSLLGALFSCTRSRCPECQ